MQSALWQRGKIISMLIKTCKMLFKIYVKFKNIHWLVFICNLFFPPASAVEGIKSFPSVRLSVCLSVSTLTSERLDIRIRNLIGILTLMLYRISSKVKVIGQWARSSHWNRHLFSFALGGHHRSNVMTCYTIWYDGVMSRHTVTWTHMAWHRKSQIHIIEQIFALHHNIMTYCNIWWHHNVKLNKTWISS